jgi:mRNA-degrading endonuclease RelE of RelBE toxin-antitoxin system
MFTIQYAEGVAEDLASLRAFERKEILDGVEQQLVDQPTQATKRKKILRGLKPPWEHVEPVWQLRVGEYRIFYDVDEGSQIVTVRAVRHKPPHKSTRDIL